MIRLDERASVENMLKCADQCVNAHDLRGDWQGVVVECGNGDAQPLLFEGTLIYFPGVTLKELKAT